MKAPTLVGIVVALHVLAVSAFIFIQGCGTVQPRPSSTSVNAPPPPVMPPKADRAAAKPSSPFKPPVVADQSPAATVRAGSVSHVVKKGETLSHVAKKYGVSTREIVAVNNLANPNSVSIGQTIMIPAHGSLKKSAASSATPEKAAASPRNIDLSSGDVYVVQSGDSLSKIAVKYGTTVAALREANGLTGDRINVGQKLALPAGSAAGSSVTEVAKKAEAEPVVEVKPPPEPADVPDIDSLLLEEEAIAESAAPAAAVAAAVDSIASDETPIMYTVVQGDTIDEIAKLFIVSRQDIMDLNQLEATAELKPGQKLKIPPSAL